MSFRAAPRTLSDRPWPYLDHRFWRGNVVVDGPWRGVYVVDPLLHRPPHQGRRVGVIRRLDWSHQAVGPTLNTPPREEAPKLREETCMPVSPSLLQAEVTIQSRHL